MERAQPDTTTLLSVIARGDEAAAAVFLPRVYAELRAPAGHSLARERPDHSLEPTALVHEAYLRLVDQKRVKDRDQSHCFALAAQAMRRTLVDRRATHRDSPLSEMIS